MKFKSLPTQERLKELLGYDPETGIFTWKNPLSTKIKPGTVAGTLRSDGYVKIKINSISYFAQRLAWLYEYGLDPCELEIDHINHDKSDNRIINLRTSTRQQNQRNSEATGFSWHELTGKWIARIMVDGRHIHLGSFTCPWQAHEAYWDARYKYFGEFA
jgi:hypothetical protein